MPSLPAHRHPALAAIKQRPVTAIHTNVCWNKEGGHVVTHHYAEAEELGDQFSTLDPGDKTMLSRLVTSLNQSLPPLTYTIGQQTITAQPEVRSYMVRFDMTPPVVHVGIGWTLPTGQETGTAIDYIMDTSYSRNQQEVAGLPADIHDNFYAWSQDYWHRSHARFGLTPLEKRI